MFQSKKIPTLISTKGWDEEPIYELYEQLIPLSEIKSPELIIKPIYHKQKIKGAVNECYVRKTVANQLLQAAKLLPDGYRFLIWDTWRPTNVQKALFEQYKKQFERERPELSEEDLLTYTTEYVSMPSKDHDKPSPHSTGGSIDLSIVDADGHLLNMGTEFDEMTEKSNTRYFEEKIENGEVLNETEKETLQNRRLLFHVMAEAGFTNHSAEWWHFDYGNQFWSRITNEPAMYGYIEV